MATLDFPDWQPNPVVATTYLYTTVSATGSIIVPAPGAGLHLVLVRFIISDTGGTAGFITIKDTLGVATLAQLYLAAETTLVLDMSGLPWPSNDGLEAGGIAGTLAITTLYGIAPG